MGGVQAADRAAADDRDADRAVLGAFYDAGRGACLAASWDVLWDVFWDVF
jgi:hypothetical protein